MDRRKALTALSALANEARLDLIRLLVPLGAEGLPAGEIARRLDLPASRLSFHLSALEQAGLLRSRRVARNIFYSVDAEGLGGVIGWLLNDCCMEHPEVIACCRHGQQVARAGIQAGIHRPAVLDAVQPPEGIVKTCPG